MCQFINWHIYHKKVKMSIGNVPVWKVSHLPQKSQMSIGNVPVWKVSHLSQKGQNVKSNYASLESVT